MFEAAIHSGFSAAHNIRGHKGRCEKMHGHNWRVEVFAGSEKLNRQGMVLDFADLKKNLNNILSQLDHKVLNGFSYFKKINPTSENIARYIYDKMKRRVSGFDCRLLKITVWETETSCAAYYE